MKKSQNAISKCFSLGFLSKVIMVFSLLFLNVEVLALDDVTAPIISNVALSQTELTAGNIVSITADFSDETPEGSTIYAQYTYVDGGWGTVGFNMYLDPNSGKISLNLGFNEYMWNGVYAFTKIVATDGAGNSVEYPLEGLTFTVSGGVDRDTTPPVISNVTLSQTEVQPGDVLYISADISDASLYMNVMSYLHYSKDQNNYTSQIDLFYNSENGKLEGYINISESMTNGIWTLNKLSARDAQGNWADLYLTGLTFNVNGGTELDITPPVFNSLTLSKTELVPGDTLFINVAIEDMNIDNAYGRVYAISQSSQIEKEAYLAYNPTSGKLEGSIAITESMANDTWMLKNLYISDSVGNGKAVELIDYTFTINSGVIVTVPEVSNFTISQTEVEVGDTLYFTVDINYESLESVYGVLYYYDNYNSHESNVYYNSETGKLEGSLQITDLMNKGINRFSFLEVRYGVGNWITLDLSAFSFKILNGEFEVDVTSPVISNITLSQSDLQPGDVLTISSDIEDATLNGSYGYAFLNYVGHIYAFPIDLVYNAISGKIEGSIEIPSSMWNGTWKVQYFNVWDGVRNANYNELDGYNFNITGSVEPDFSAPVISNITFSKSNATHGETVNISADVDDASKQESWAQLVFYNENNNNLTNWVYLSYNPESDKLEGSFFVYENVSYGNWILQRVTTSDKYSNYNEFQLENVSYTISDGTQIDTESPEISNFTLSKTEVVVGESLYFTIDINDATLNGAYGTLSYYTPNYSQSEFNIYYNALSGKLEGILNISEVLPDGIYRLIGLNAKDGVGNSTYMDLSALSFTIKINQPDQTPPVISNITISQTELQPGDVLTISSDISDESLIGSYGSVYLNYVGKYYVIPVNVIFNSTTGRLESTFEIPSTMWNGSWRINYYIVWDGAGNYTSIQPAGLNFTITGGVEPDLNAPEISNITLSQTNVMPEDTIYITADIVDDTKQGSWAQLEFLFEENSNKYNWVQLLYNPETDRLEGSFIVPETMYNGNWILNRVFTGDGVSNYGNFDVDNISITVSGGTEPDVTSPEISNFSLDKTVAKVGDMIYVSVDINDATLDGSYGNLSYNAPDNSVRETSVYYNSTTGRLDGYLSITEDMPVGIYRFGGLNAWDGAGNSSNTDISTFSFTVQNEHIELDVTPPVVTNTKLSQTELSPGDTLTITSDIKDETPIGLTGYAYLNYVGKYYVIPVNVIFNSTTGKLEATFEIPSTMWNGSWRINYYIVWDGAGNYTHFEPIGLNFTITGGVEPDLYAPEISNITLSQTNVMPGDTVYITADIVDDSKQGSWAQLEFLFEENSNKYNWVALYYNSETDRLEGSFIVPETMYNGNWILNRVFTGDGVSNYGNFDVDNISITVSGGTEPDVTSPEISNFTLDKTVAKVGELIFVSVDINDSTLDGSYGSLSYYAPDNSVRETSVYYNSTTGRLDGYLAITEDMPVGIYRFNGLNAWDGAGNSTYIELNAFSFTNENQHIELDGTSPVISNIKLSQTEARPGDLLTLTLDISDETPLGSSGYVFLRHVGNFSSLSISFIFNSKTGRLESVFELPSSMLNGTWTLVQMHVWDGAGNYIYFDSVDLNLSIIDGVDPDLTAPEVSNISLSQMEVRPGDIINITADIVDDSKQGSWAQLEFILQSYVYSYTSVPLNYNPESDKLEGTFAISETMYNGNWKLNRIYTGDGVGNNGNFEVNNISINVSGARDYDDDRPVLSNFTLSETELSPGDTLVITVDIEDETLEGSYGFLNYSFNRNMNTNYVSLSYNSLTGKLEGSLEITDLMWNGKWYLQGLNVFDGNGNTSWLNLNTQYFTISGGVDPDLTSPVISNVTLSQTDAQLGDVVTISADIADETLLGSRGQVSLKLRGSNYQQWMFLNFNESSGKLEGSVSIDYAFSNGIWDLVYFYGIDGVGNYTSSKIEGINITITGSSEPDLDSPEISEITLSNTEFNVGDELTITAKVNDANLYTINGTVFISSQDGRDGRVIILQYDNQTNILSGSIIVDEFMSRGSWNIELFHATDYYQNETELTSLDYPFTVNSSVDPETVRPNVVLSKDLVKNGDRLNITVDISDRDYLKDTYGNAELYMPLTNETYYVSLMYDSSIESLVASFDIPDYFIDGEWVINKIGLYDGTNHQFYYDSNNSFVVDNTPPVVEGVENGELYNTDKLISFNEGSATLNDNDFVSGNLATFEGENTLVVTDLLGHQTVVNFRIDKTAPIVEGLESDTYVLSTPVINFTEGTALLNSQEFISGNSVSTFGNYTLVVTDEAGNLTKKTFTVTLPKVLGLVSSTLSYKSVELSWNSVEFASGYEVYRNNINTGVYELIVDTLDLGYVDINLLNDQVYDYKVRAYIPVNGTKFFGEFSEVTNSRTSLLTPQNAQANSVSTTSISLTWEPVLDADSYDVYSSTSELGTYKSIGSSNSTSLLNTQLSGGITYFYKVRATSTVNGVMIYGEFTSPFNATTVPSQVMGLSAVPSSSSTIKLTWNVVSNVKGYEVYRLNSLTNKYEFIADITGTSFTDSKRIVNTIYYYKVKAYITVKKDKFYGDFSETVSASTIRK